MIRFVHLLLLLSTSLCHAWLSPAKTGLRLSRLSSMTERNSEGTLNDENHPCWNELYGDDDDCMASFNSASFVAQDWIKSMPCASGLEDCDFPEDLSVPERRPEGGLDQVDVMDFLGLKRAKPITVPKSGNDDTALKP